GGSAAAARAWVKGLLYTDVQAGAAVYLNTLVPAHVFARGRDLDTATPTFYAATVTRGMEGKLLRVVKGTPTSLGSVKAATYVSDKWGRVTRRVEGGAVRAQVVRLDTNQYLESNGQWAASPAWAISANDATIPAGGEAGVGRGASYSGTVFFDDFAVAPPTG